MASRVSHSFWCVLAALLLSFTQGAAQAAEKRVALLVGNSTYSGGLGALTFPQQDVTLLAAALKKIGFQVQTANNVDRRAMLRAIRAFSADSKDAAVAFFYFSGHGMQSRGENYLIPVGAALEDENDADTEGVRLASLLTSIEEAGPRTAIVVLDACRDNPVATRTKSSAKGLVRADANGKLPTNTYVAFAADSGRVARDNGVYAKTLAEQLTQPIGLRRVFDLTAMEVMRQTQGSQRPRRDDGLTEDVFLAGAAPAAAGAQQVAVARPSRDDVERESWDAVRNSNSTAAVQAFLREYPNGVYAAQARIRLAMLQPGTPVAAPAAPAVPSAATPPAAASLGLVTLAPGQVAGSGTLAKIQSTGVVTMGVREGAAPLSYSLGDARYGGFHVEVCQRILTELERALGRKIEVRYTPVTSANRIPLVQNDTVDIECGSTTNNAVRQREIAFLNTTIVIETRLAVRSDSGIAGPAQLAGRSVVATAGTTSLAVLRRSAPGVSFTELQGRDHADSFAQLEAGRADAFVMDDVILAGLIAGARNPGAIRMVGEALQVEPVAIMVRKDAGWKKFGNDVLAQLASIGELARMWDRWFVQPIPPRNARVGLPLSDSTRAAWARADDRPVEEYARR